MRTHRRPDPLSKLAAAGIAAGRASIGLGISFATKPALRALGFSETDASGRTLARIAGSRDLALAGLTVASLDDRNALRRVSIAAAATDAGDVVAFGLALARREGIDRAAIVGAGSAFASVVLGIWLADRLA